MDATDKLIIFLSALCEKRLKSVSHALSFLGLHRFTEFIDLLQQGFGAGRRDFQFVSAESISHPWQADEA